LRVDGKQKQAMEEIRKHLDSSAEQSDKDCNFFNSKLITETYPKKHRPQKRTDRKLSCILKKRSDFKIFGIDLSTKMIKLEKGVRRMADKCL
jgi:hypothetical protein